ncbi:phosphotransferase enzyme family protein [Oceanobacter mangrovi]|uniref:phosphotransferase enzyme family protein n=1 Tax=Oceanobacter mangrovi TaxID=2862510 RepID=UPI001FE82F31|nr:phosphotransferase [Oceanobacter mangrovi]
MGGIYDSDFVTRLAKGVESLAGQWGATPAAQVRLLTLSENATFILQDPTFSKPMIVRVHRPDYHSLIEIQSELAWIQALKASELLTTPAPIAMLNGELVGSFDDQGHTRYVVAFEFAPGTEPNADDDLSAGFETLGAISARLHLHTADWPVPSGFVRKRWDFKSAFGDQPLWGDWRAALGLEPAGEAILQQLLDVLEQRLAAYGSSSDRFGLIHTDLRLANLLVTDDQLTVIDFDDCGFSWFMYDFASAISFFETSPTIPALQAAWLKGYRSVRPLGPEHEAMLPDFIMFRRMLLTAWIASHPETETAAEAGLADYTQGTIELAKQYLQSHSEVCA